MTGEAPTVYHYVLTVQWVSDGQLLTKTFDNTFEQTGGLERASIYRRLTNRAAKEVGADVVATLFWSLEPNAL
ncbi:MULTISPECIES: hypothetical protein [Streptomyces]|uniref:hypothetical protein n=1 Tax=Streptomyces TaxID=1883 RepID=UPI00073DD730|nr:hypothetical protein [Streptomyces sp. FBKL.4005]MYU28631.1 hypothetical protein [Streptomyces sp. SID7810]OYP17031.1 hypothetical protein CFC35_23065 [Streptomyces sp. FBKL.4005]CUW29670.1 hypothetical protein TUE45_04379 [Streptomyces reticuli]